MKVLLVSVLVTAFALDGASAHAAGEQPSMSTLAADPTDCPLDGYKSMTLPLDEPIPDIGFLGPLGPIQFPDDGSLITDVIMAIEIEHTWVGNLVVTIEYDVDCAGSNVVGPVRLLCRQGLDGCPEEHTCCGCSADLIAGTPYFFADSGAKEMSNDGEQCSSQVAHGCYRPASESEFDLSVFDGLPKNGCWFMRIFDGAGGDVGTIASWTIYLSNESATPIESASWGAIKSQFDETIGPRPHTK